MTTYRRHTIESLTKLAASFPSRGDFYKEDPSAYSIALRKGLLNEVFPQQGYRKFTDEELIAHMLTFPSTKVFRRDDIAAYTTARNRGLLDRSHCAPQDNDAFYLMQVLGEIGLFKAGATSSRLRPHKRLAKQNTAAKMRHAYAIPPTQICGKATDIEKFALTLGQEPGLSGFDGCSEYRIYTREDVQAIKDMVELCRV